MDGGYIKLWRKSIDSQVFADADLWKLWCLCLMKANHKEVYVSIYGIAEPIKLYPGQFITGRNSLWNDFYGGRKPRKHYMSQLTLWRKLLNLQNMTNLNIRSHAKYTIITITNWSAYQQSEQQVNNRRTTGEQQVNTDKNDKNDKNDKKTTYGEFRNVHLTKEEHGKLETVFGRRIVSSRIEDLSGYMESKGRRYKSHYATLRNWLRKDQGEKNRKFGFLDEEEDRDEQRFIQGTDECAG